MTFYLGKLPDRTMKTSTIFFYGSSEEGKLAQELSLKERQEHRIGVSRDATVFDGEKEKDVSAVVILPEVRNHHRRKIMATYGDVANELNAEDGSLESIAPEKEVVEINPDAPVKMAVHRGGGKWYVMLGEDRLSGPHSRDEAEELAK